MVVCVVVLWCWLVVLARVWHLQTPVLREGGREGGRELLLLMLLMLLVVVVGGGWWRWWWWWWLVVAVVVGGGGGGGGGGGAAAAARAHPASPPPASASRPFVCCRPSNRTPHVPRPLLAAPNNKRGIQRRQMVSAGQSTGRGSRVSQRRTGVLLQSTPG